MVTGHYCRFCTKQNKKAFGYSPLFHFGNGYTSNLRQLNNVLGYMGNTSFEWAHTQEQIYTGFYGKYLHVNYNKTDLTFI